MSGDKMLNAPASASGEDPKGDWPKDKQKNIDGKAPDYGQLTVDALRRHTTTPEFTAGYKAWLEYLGPELWTPVAKADHEEIMAEERAAKKAKPNE